MFLTPYSCLGAISLIENSNHLERENMVFVITVKYEMMMMILVMMMMVMVVMVILLHVVIISIHLYDNGNDKGNNYGNGIR